MSELKRFLGKSEIIEIDGLKFTVKPFDTDDLDILMDFSNENKRAGAIKKIINGIIKENYPDATEQEIKEFPIEHLSKLMDAVGKVNGLEIDKSIMPQNVRISTS